MKEINIGNKGIMIYLYKMLDCEDKEITIKARSRYIIKAVDVVMIYKRFFGKLITEKVLLNYEKVKDKYGNKVYISTIEIIITKDNGLKDIKGC